MSKQNNLPFNTTFKYPFEKALATISVSQVESLLQLGTEGHFPLFFSDWISSSFKEESKTSISLSNARKNLKREFDNLSRHRSIERKKIAICSWDIDRRDDFIHSFIRIVESRYLDTNLKGLQ